VIQVKVCDEDTVDHVCQIKNAMTTAHPTGLSILVLSRIVTSHVTALGVLILLGAIISTSIQERKIGKLLLIDHVNSTVKHDSSTADLCNDARSADVLTST
jgi:hypothetical protein